MTGNGNGNDAALTGTDKTNERIYYYCNLPNGCPDRLLDEDGKVVWTARYDAFGKVKKLPVNEVEQPIRLQGQYFDEETGLHYTRFRYYCPEIGSFISKDPLKLAAGENVYAYAPNVQRWIDPLGLCKKSKKPKGATFGFSTQDKAATAALKKANPQSIQDNLEYGGLIYRKNGQYGYSGPIRGTDQGVNPWNAPVPAGTDVVGDYHTHADYSIADPKTGAAIRTSDPLRDDFNSDNFSFGDYAGIKQDAIGTPGYKGYLGTPSGTFKVFEPATGKEGVLP